MPLKRYRFDLTKSKFGVCIAIAMVVNQSGRHPCTPPKNISLWHMPSTVRKEDKPTRDIVILAIPMQLC